MTRALSRPFSLGVDGEGCTHYYYRPADTVVVFTADGVARRKVGAQPRAGG